MHIRLDLFVSTKDNVQANLGPILTCDSISFHLSHQPPLKVTEHFLCSKSDKKWHIYYIKVLCNFERWLMAQMRAYTIPMKNWTQICLTIVFCRHKQVQPDVHKGWDPMREVHLWMGVEGGVPVSEDAGSLGLNGIMSGDESAQRATHGAI